MQSRWLKGSLIGIGALVLSTVGIFASDKIRGLDGGLQMAGVKKSGICNEGMVPLKVDGNTICVDVYEASPSEKCPNKVLTNIVQSEKNATSPECYAASVKGATPWNYISLPQAQRMCAGAGKRLPKSNEWYHMALGTNPETCTVSTPGVVPTGSESCISGAGVYDAIGNVWEWVDETVTGKTFEGRDLPNQGYVTSVDANGVAITSGDSADDLYGKDYFWSGNDGVFGMIRGGFYGSNQDAGLYTINASVQTSFATQGVGFRCVEDVL